MRELATAVFVPLILSAFIYLILIAPVEAFRRSLATVAFKRRLFAFSVVLAYGLLLLLSRLSAA